MKKAHPFSLLRFFLTGIFFTASVLMIFALSLYGLVIIYLVISPGSFQALENGRVKMRGIVREKDDTVMVLEKLTCNVSDCHFLASKEVLIKRSEFDSGFNEGDKVIVSMQRSEELSDYRPSKIEDGLRNKRMFVPKSIDKDHFQLMGVDKREVSFLIMIGLALSITSFLGYRLFKNFFK